MMPDKKNKIEILDVNIDFNLETENNKLEEEMFSEIQTILESKKKVDEQNKDEADQIIDILKTKEMSKEDVAQLTNASGSKLSGIVTKIKTRLSKQGLQLEIVGKANKKTYKIKGVGDELPSKE